VTVRFQARSARVTFLAVLSLMSLLCGCRDSPSEVLRSASEAAVQEDLATLQDKFGVETRRRLERAWQRAGTPDGSGWDHLATGLVFEGPEGRAPLEVIEETIHGEYSEVVAKAGAAKRRYYLRKLDGQWRVELGLSMRYMRAAAKAEAADPEKKKKADKKRKAAGDEEDGVDPAE
jgi:hypothetical protein